MVLVHIINKHLWASSFVSTGKSNIHQLKKYFYCSNHNYLLLKRVLAGHCTASQIMKGSLEAQVSDHVSQPFSTVLAFNGSNAESTASHGQSKWECPLPCPSVSRDALRLPGIIAFIAKN